MVKQHLKRLSAPATWPVMRKSLTFVKRPLPGAHAFEHGLSMDTLLKDLLGLASSTREVNFILQAKGVLVNGAKRKEKKFLVGLFDVVTLPELKKHYRIVLTRKGTLQAVEVPEKEAKLVPSRIVGKTLLKGGKLQLNLGDGTNLLLEKNAYRIGDALLLEMPMRKIVAHLPLEKKAMAYLVSGKHSGTIGIVEEVRGTKIVMSTKAGVFQTKKKYAFPMGTDTPAITVTGG